MPRSSWTLRWPVPIYMRVGYVLVRVFQNERLNRFLRFFASLIKDDGGIVSFEISA